MKRHLRWAILVLGLVGLTGCLSVPKDTYQWGPARVSIPKNAEVSGLSVVVEGTNQVTVKADSIRTFNDPKVIDATAKGQVLIIREGGKILEGTVEAGVNAATK